MKDATAAWPPLSDEDYLREVEQQVGPRLVGALADVELLVLDADGVLTPGNLIYGPDGEALKEFDSHDGLGLVMARLAGLKRAVLTGRDSAIVQRRCRELKFDVIKLARFDKAAALREILAETGCAAARTLYMGDDLIDLPAMLAAGIAVGVPALPEELRQYCAFITHAEGGHGAVREVVDLVLKAGRRYGRTLDDLIRKEARPS